MSDTLPVGEELNLLLYKHLFGVEPDGFTEEGFPYRMQTIYDGEQPFIGRVLMNTLLDGDGMLLLVEKMRETPGVEFKLVVWQPHHGGFAQFTGANGEEYRVTFRGVDDAPTAVGQAALRAKGVLK